ncbi:MAG: cyclase family protein [Chloroflexota bacterium]|nr:cyclase family protein [Chloroflexota bacterium]
MKVHDISMTLCPYMPVYPGEPQPIIQPLSQIARGDVANVSLLTLGSHTGTHIDAPCHFLADGQTVDKLALDALVGPALVVQAQAAQEITAADLESLAIPQTTERLLFKTRNSELWGKERFQTDFVSLAADAARWLVERGIRLVAIDYLSVERFGAEFFEVHETLLRAGIVVVEGVDLRRVSPGPYFLACLPLKIEGGDGAPARAVLVEL